MKDIQLIRKILRLVSYEDEDEFDGRYYWGHDTSMDAKEIERQAKAILKQYKEHSQKTSSENNNQQETTYGALIDSVERASSGNTEQLSLVDNPQDDPGESSRLAKGDNGNSTFPADLYSQKTKETSQ